jgi:sterol desaturase/sphingolipid hydroxylase (fatty acid hydroxylase superfamily)
VDVYQHEYLPAANVPNPAGRLLSRLLHPIALAIVAGHLALLGAAWWTLQHVLPDTLTLQLFGKLHLVSQLHQKLIDRIVVAGVLVPGVFLVEYLWMGWRESSIRRLLVQRSASSRSDIVCFLASLMPPMTLISAIMSLGVVYLSGECVRSAIARWTGLSLSLATQPLVLQATILLVVYSLFDYFSHRLDHSRLFWPLHRFHHAAQEFAVLTAARVHPAVFTAVVGTTLPAVLLGASPEALADMGLVVVTIRLVIHSRIESDFGVVGRWIVQSPMHHRLHHSLNRQPINLGLLPIWDRLFGTWRDAPAMPMKIGVPTPYRHGVWVGPDVWRDYCEFWRGLLALARSRRLA